MYYIYVFIPRFEEAVRSRATTICNMYLLIIALSHKFKHYLLALIGGVWDVTEDWVGSTATTICNMYLLIIHVVLSHKFKHDLLALIGGVWDITDRLWQGVPGRISIVSCTNVFFHVFSFIHVYRDKKLYTNQVYVSLFTDFHNIRIVFFF